MRNKSLKAHELNKSNLRIVISIQYCFILFLIVLSLAYEISGIKSEPLIYPLCCFLLIQTIWTFYSWYVVTKSLFHPYILFFVSAVIFNGGQVLLEVFGLNEHGVLGLLKFSPSTMVLTIFLVTLSLACFHLGALFSSTNVKQDGKVNNNKREIQLKIQHKASYLIGWLLLAVSFVPTVFTIKKSADVVREYGYGGLWQHDDYETDVVNTGADILASFIIPASLFLLAGTKYKKNSKYISLSLIIIYTLVRFALGQRNQAIMPLICFAWLWNRIIFPLPKAIIFGISTLMVSVVFPLVAITRNTSGEDRLSLDYLIESYQNLENPIIESIAEMGGSMLTVAYTIELVPKVRDFQMGAEYLYALLTLIPNIFGGKLHPSIARGIPDVWLVNEVNPVMADYNNTYGFSFIAEAYLNFGWYGTLITLGVMGFLFGKLIFWAINFGNPAKMAMLASFLSFFLFYPRGALVFMVRPLVWYSLIPYLGTLMLTNFTSQRADK